MITELARITEIAKAKPKECFTSLAHLIDETASRSAAWGWTERRRPASTG